MKQLKVACARSARAKVARITSTAETCLARIMSARRLAGVKARASADMSLIPTGRAAGGARRDRIGGICLASVWRALWPAAAKKMDADVKGTGNMQIGIIGLG